MAEKRELKTIYVCCRRPGDAVRAAGLLEKNTGSRFSLRAGGGCHSGETCGLERDRGAGGPQERPAVPSPAESGCLFLTDIPERAAQLQGQGVPVLAWAHGQEREFPGVKYVVGELDGADADYYERVFLRLTGRPWHILDTPRCTVRETAPEDVDAFYEIYRGPSVARYMENLFEDRQEEIQYARDYMEKVYAFYGFGMWSVLLRETGRVIGRAGLTLREGFDAPELGFVIGVPWQGRGLACEVCRAVISYGFEELGFGEIQALAEPSNRASLGLLQKLGFRPAEEIVLAGKTYARLCLKSARPDFGPAADRDA